MTTERANFSAWEQAPFTYREVGATAHTMPPGYHRVTTAREVGRGESDFAAARAVIMSYGMQRGAGLRVRPSTPTVAVGTVVLLTAPFLGPLVVPCRVVYVIAEPTRAGFAYGTLPGHPESGEEVFSVELRSDGAVVATVAAFSRPGRWFTRLLGPAARLGQAVISRRYLAAVARGVRDGHRKT